MNDTTRAHLAPASDTRTFGGILTPLGFAEGRRVYRAEQHGCNVVWYLGGYREWTGPVEVDQDAPADR